MTARTDTQWLALIVERRGMAWVRNALAILGDLDALDRGIGPARDADAISRAGLARTLANATSHTSLDTTAFEHAPETSRHPVEPAGPDPYDPETNPNVKERGPGYVIFKQPPAPDDPALGAPRDLNHDLGNGPAEGFTPTPILPEATIDFAARPGINDHRPSPE